MTSSTINRICTAIFILVLVNFIVFVGIGKYIGGEAVHGKVEGGHYYLAKGYFNKYSTKDIGQYIEVSSATFRYSQVHGYFVLATFPLGLVAGFVAFLVERKQKHKF